MILQHSELVTCITLTAATSLHTIRNTAGYRTVLFYGKDQKCFSRTEYIVMKQAFFSVPSTDSFHMS